MWKAIKRLVRGRPDAEQFEDVALRALILLIERLGTMAKTLDEVLEAVRASSTKVDSIIAYTAGIKQRLDEALAGVLTAEQQAKVDEIFAIESSDAVKIDAALTATPTPPNDVVL